MRTVFTNKIKQISIIPLIVILVTGVTPAFAGPVIIDGTDSPDHGQNWPYVQNAAKALLEQETRGGVITVDILSMGTIDNNSGGGGVINLAASNLGVTVQHCTGFIAMQTCFDQIVNGTINPRMLYFPGTGSPNDLDDRFNQGNTLTANAQTISQFVASGGAVLSHGSGNTALGWLNTLLPNINFPGGCTNNGATRTDEGIELFPDITDNNIQGVCHNHFTGDFGGLVVLALDGDGRPFILGLAGGAGGSIEEGVNNKKGGDNQWDTRPTFGVSHEDRQSQVVENGFSFNTEQFMLTDNHHTDFAEQTIEIGTTNSFSATVYADKKLKIQEFLFGIPKVGEAQLAELGVEVWYDRDGNIEDVKVVQKSDVIDAETVSVSHEKTKCLSTDPEPLCDTTTVSMTFLEPLADKVMAIKAIDYDLRDQRTFLNEGFDISGESLNPMISKMIPSNQRDQGLLKVTQLAKYSPYWQSEDGRMFEMNSFGSFKEINQSFERFSDDSDARTRQHSGFGGILNYEQNRATQVFDSTKLISDLPDSFGHHFEMTKRFNENMMQKISEQQEIAKEILKEMEKQYRYY